ncbi:MAG TPA: hypothetical protein VJK30_06490 [Coxiellaceae bacterium]|nr:MAG: hypothetical protein A3E81_05720 [Gammaproteobacteria bacterium RIFCSPHIGHO2_12_FULL_36_30]HLB56956.1 hypothetical protein [Coxiellaceae bacterium]
MPNEKPGRENPDWKIDFFAICLVAPLATAASFPLNSWLVWMQTIGVGKHPFQFLAYSKERYPASRFPIVRASYASVSPYFVNSIPSKLIAFFPVLFVGNQFPESVAALWFAYLASAVAQSVISYPARIKQIYHYNEMNCNYTIYLSRKILKRAYVPWFFYLLAINAFSMEIWRHTKQFFNADPHSFSEQFFSGAISTMVIQPFALFTENYVMSYMSPNLQKLPIQSSFLQKMLVRTTARTLEWGLFYAATAIARHKLTTHKEGIYRTANKVASLLPLDGNFLCPFNP